jgi:CTP synthase (UTP-ammonia lyase)
MPTPSIALLGDRSEHPSHREFDALIPRLDSELGVSAEWLGTDSGFDITSYDGVWVVPGGPYADDRAVLEALRTVREQRVPLLGTCSGMQYAVVEYVRNVVGDAATHAESDGIAQDNVVSALACALQGERRLVTSVPGTRFAGWCPQPFHGMHFCSYAPTASAVASLQRVGVIVGATAADAGAEVLEFPDHPFYVTSMFQPHFGAASAEPIHELVVAFIRAVASAAARPPSRTPN